MFDFLFVLTEYSDNEGEEFLVECASLGQAKAILEINGFQPREYKYIDRLTPAEGEMLGLDTY